MISVSLALSRVARRVHPLPDESVRPADAFGRVLSRPLKARIDHPAFRTTAMDGYAVSGIRKGEPFRIRSGVVAAGDSRPAPLAAGEALRVMTGAALPKGTEAIVPVEEARTSGGTLRTIRPPRKGAHIRSRGEIFRRGEIVARTGTRLTPEILALAAAAGADPVFVYRLPRAAIAVTGAEIAPAGRRPRMGKIWNSNGPGLVAAFARHGVCARELATLPDDPRRLERFFRTAGKRYDLFLTTGGVSAGDFDETVKAARRAGFRIQFHGVSLKPGKPVAFGTSARSIWFGLPGNPVSAMTTFELFVALALERLAGRRGKAPRVMATLDRPVRRKPGRETYLDGRLVERAGRLFALPIRSHGSHDLLASSRRNILIRIPVSGGALRRGTPVECIPLSALFS